MNKLEVARMLIGRGAMLPLDFAIGLANEGVFLEEFEASINGFNVEKFVDEFEYYDNI